MSKQDFKNTLIYTGLSFLPATTQFLLLPVYMNHLSVSEFGVFQGMTIVQILVSTLIGLSLQSSVSRYYFSYRQDPVRLKVYLSSIFWFIGILSLITFALGLATGTFFFDVLYKSNSLDYFPYGFIAVTTGLLNAFIPMFLIIFRIIQHLKGFVAISLIAFLGNMIGQFLGMTYFHTNVEGLMWAKLGVAVILFLYLMFYVLKHYGVHLKKSFLKPSLYFALPLLPYGLLSWMYILSDNTLILRFLDDKFLGVYNFAVNLSAAVELLVVAVSQAIQPKIFEIYTATRKKAQEKYNQELHFNYDLLMNLTIFAIVGLIFVGQNLFLVIPKAEYEATAIYIPIMCIGFLFRVHQIVFTFPLFYQRKTKIFAYLAVGSVILGFVTHALLITHIELWAAVWASVLARAIQVPFIYYVAQKHAYFKYNLKTTFVIPFLFAAMLLLLSYLQVYLKVNMFWSSTLLMCTVLTYLVLVYKKALLKPTKLSL